MMNLYKFYVSGKKFSNTQFITGNSWHNDCRCSITTIEIMQSLTLTQPDDWHLHVRDGEILQHVVPPTARQFGRAIIMPNLKPPVTTTAMALQYRERILAALVNTGDSQPPAQSAFHPLMTLYLTDNTTPDEIIRAKQSGQVHAVKYYPAGATTNSDAGVTEIEKTYETLACMAENQIPLLVHGEVTDTDVDIFDREKRFIDTVLAQLHNKFTQLRIVFEHITTQDAVAFVNSCNELVAATITPHHLLFNRNALLAGGIRPHYYCLPVLKRHRHQQALIEAATSGSSKFFLGTDSAPHARHTKESACGCAGIYSAHAAIELYATAFEQAGALDKLEAFASFYGADFYQLPRNKTRITLVKQAWEVPSSYAFSNDDVVTPLYAGQQIPWKLSLA